MREQVDAHSSKKRPSALVHLTTVSPSRYATLRNVLGQVKTRLGEDWMPSRVVEHGCGAGEGLWAAADVFGRDLREYTGIDARIPLLRSAIDILEDTSVSDADVDGENSIMGSIEKTFKSSLQGADLLRKSKQSQKKEERGDDEPERDTLVLCTHSLSSLSSDAARSAFVQSLWSTHPRAEVLVFVEPGDERGFASIASAREELLGIGPSSDPARAQGGIRIGRHVFYEESGSSEEVTPEESGSESQELQPLDGFVQSHVVAPCPHDRPCPLLHDYHLLDPTPQHLQTKTSSLSPLFHGAALGLATCTFPQRAHLPSFSRKTRGGPRNEMTTRHSFVVVRRGPRPSIESTAQTHEIPEELLRDEAVRAREGRVEELRGPSTTLLPTPEAEVEPAGASLNAIEDDEEARAELFKLLPQALARELERAGGEASAKEMDEAMRMAQEVMQGSADLAEAPHEGSAADEGEAQQGDEEVALTSALLSQARQLQQEPSAEVPAVPEDTNYALQGLATSLDSYSWPRLIRTPLKKGGHVTLDACSPNGSIQRFTISKSTGKQAYHEARKASWGDIFPRADEGKGLRERVAAADVEKRNVSLKKGPGGKKRDGQAGSGSSAAAIGPDAVAPTHAAIEKRPTYSNVSPAAAPSATGRRQHYKESPMMRRDSRKRSMGSYEREINEAMSEDESSPDDKTVS